MQATWRARAAFTLVEVLVVVAVIAILTAILLPGLQTAREAGRSARCEANLRQWGVAAQMYADENCGKLPRRGQGVQATMNISRPEDWFNALPPLLGLPRYLDLALANARPRPGDRSLWTCPNSAAAEGPKFFAYGMNMRLSTWDEPGPARIDAVGPISVQVFLSEGIGDHCSVLPARAEHSPVARHQRRAVVSFLDGHAQLFTGSYIGCGIGDPQRYNVQWLVPGSTWQPPP